MHLDSNQHQKCSALSSRYCETLWGGRAKILRIDGLTKHKELVTGTAQDQPPACKYLKKNPTEMKGEDALPKQLLSMK